MRNEAMRRASWTFGVFLIGSFILGCASSETEDGTQRPSGDREITRTFDTWASVFRHYVPRARLRGDCVLSLGRSAEDPPVIEIGGLRTFDGCPPSGFAPSEIVRAEVLDANEAGTILGRRGQGGLIRLFTE